MTVLSPVDVDTPAAPTATEPDSRPSVYNAPADVDIARASDELTGLADSASDLASRAHRLGMRQTARQLERLAMMLRASRTRLATNPRHLGVAEAYILTAVDMTTTAARRIGAHQFQGPTGEASTRCTAAGPFRCACCPAEGCER